MELLQSSPDYPLANLISRSYRYRNSMKPEDLASRGDVSNDINDMLAKYISVYPSEVVPRDVYYFIFNEFSTNPNIFNTKFAIINIISVYYLIVIMAIRRRMLYSIPLAMYDHYIIDGTELRSTIDEQSRLVRFWAIPFLEIIYDAEAIDPFNTNRGVNIEPRVFFAVNEMMADVTSTGSELARRIWNTSDPWFTFLNDKGQYINYTSVEQVLKRLEDAVTEYEEEESGPGSVAGREAIDRNARAAGQLSDECDFYDYYALELIATNNLKGMSLMDLCQLVSTYQNQLNLEGSCDEYSVEDIVDVLEQLVRQLPKVEICKFIRAYPAVIEEISIADEPMIIGNQNFARMLKVYRYMGDVDAIARNNEIPSDIRQGRNVRNAARKMVSDADQFRRDLNIVVAGTADIAVVAGGDVYRVRLSKGSVVIDTDRLSFRIDGLKTQGMEVVQADFTVV